METVGGSSSVTGASSTARKGADGGSTGKEQGKAARVHCAGVDPGF